MYCRLPTLPICAGLTAEVLLVCLQQLQMIGFDMSWASFRVIEVMSASWFGHKRVGYLAAALSFTPQTDVILLATHLFRKAFTQNVSMDSATTEGLKYETGAALSCLANICTPDLAQDLLSDLYGMMNRSVSAGIAGHGMA
jgi:AP-3 complex subunit delta-1